jgi:hypothetical protein
MQVDDQHDALEATHGAFAAIVWLVIGAILFYSGPEVRLASWQALVFFIVGMFVAAGVIGGLSYLVIRGFTKILVKVWVVSAPTPRGAIGLTIAGYFFFAAQMLVIYGIERWTIRALFS